MTKMLKHLYDKKKHKKIWIVLLFLILPGFLAWGTSGKGRSRNEAYAGKIFGRNIPVLEYRDAVDAVRNQAIMHYGDKFDEMQKDLNLEAQAWERLIMLSEAKKRKIKTSDREVVEEITRYPFFQKNGRFDEGIYMQLLEYIFHTQPRIFEEQLRGNLTIKELYDQITADIAVSDDEIKVAFRKATEQISLSYITSNASDFLDQIHPTDDETKDYFTRNALEFKQPFSFNLEYFAVATEGKDEEKLRETLKNISRRRLDKNTDLTKLAGEFAATVTETGLFSQTDPIPGIGWSPSILNIAFKAKPGEFLPFLLIDKNYYVIRLKEKKDPSIPDFAAIKEKAGEALRKTRAETMAQEKIQACLNKLREAYAADPKAADLSKTAKTFGLKTGETIPFGFGSYIEGIGASDSLWIAATGLSEGQTSDVLSLPSGFYIIKVTSRTALDESKLAEERDALKEKVLREKKTEHFAKFLMELQQKAKLF